MQSREAAHISVPWFQMLLVLVFSLYHPFTLPGAGFKAHRLSASLAQGSAALREGPH